MGGGVDASGSAATTGCDGVVAAAGAAPALADAARGVSGGNRGGDGGSGGARRVPLMPTVTDAAVLPDATPNGAVVATTVAAAADALESAAATGSAASVKTSGKAPCRRGSGGGVGPATQSRHDGGFSVVAERRRAPRRVAEHGDAYDDRDGGGTCGRGSSWRASVGHSGRLGA